MAEATGSSKDHTSSCPLKITSSHFFFIYFFKINCYGDTPLQITLFTLFLCGNQVYNFSDFRNLASNSLTGKIPPGLGSLGKLIRLYGKKNILFSLSIWSHHIFRDLSSNSLSGTIPTELGSLSKIEGLYGKLFFSFCKMDHSYKTFLGDCPKIVLLEQFQLNWDLWANSKNCLAEFFFHF